MSQKAGTRREEQFRAFMAGLGVTLERPRVVFAFKWTKYRPDWYEPATNTYYEVIGTRQRGSSIAPTLDLMEIVHPSVEYRIVRPDGTRWMPKRHGLHENLLTLPHGEAVHRRAIEDNARLWGYRRRDWCRGWLLHAPRLWQVPRCRLDRRLSSGLWAARPNSTAP